MSGSTRTVERTLPIAASRSDLFRALLDPATLSRWMYATVRIKPQKGGAYRIDWQDSNLPASAQGEILEMEKNRRLVLSWFMEQDGCETVASFDLEEEPDGRTRLRFRHSGFPGGSEWLSRFEMVSTEWDKTLENLRFLLEERTDDRPLFYQRHQVVLPATRERTHLQWIGPAALAGWLARDAFVDPAVGGAIDLTLLDGRRVKGVIRAFVPGKHLRLLWDEDGKRSLIGISFWTDPRGCVMTLTQRSYALSEADRDRLANLWQDRFRRLEACLAREPGEWPIGGEESFELTRILPASRAEVWKACSDPASLIGWLCDRAEFTLTVGRPFALLWTGYGETRGRVVEVVPEERLRLTWEIPSYNATTQVEYRFEDDGANPNGSRLRLIHSGWGVSAEWKPQVEGHRIGWAWFLAMLDLYLREHHRGPRRTFFLRRRLAQPVEQIGSCLTTTEGLASWLGSNAGIDLREGGPFHLRLEDGTRLEGTILSADPKNGIALSFDRPDPIHLEICWGVAKEGTYIRIDGSSFGCSEEWPERQREFWMRALDRI